MEVSVNFYWVVIAVVGGLAGLSLITHFVVRRHHALIWLAASLLIGGVNTYIFARGGSGMSTLAYLAVLDPCAYFCVAQAARLGTGKSGTPSIVLLPSIGLVAMSLVLIAGQVGTVPLRAVPFQIAGAILVIDAIVAVARGRKGWPERGLLFGLGLFLTSHLVRLPFFPSLLDSGRAYPSIASPWLNWVLLGASSVYVPMVALSIIARDLRGHINDFRETSKRDGLTGLLTRLAFERAAEDSHPRYGALVLADLDHFKVVNDTFGHPAGDEALRTFARLCGGHSVISGRMGGEEFALLLPGATLKDAEEIATDIRAAFGTSRPVGLEDHRLTASFGIAAYGGNEGFRDTLIKADRALYRAKRQGRDCVVLHGTIAGEDANTILRIA